MKHLLLLANLGLLALLVVAAAALQGHNPESRWPKLEPLETDARNSADAGTRPPAPDMRQVGLRKADKDVLWEKTLFNPDRTELIDQTKSDDDEQEEPERSSKYGDMELIGIGKINKRQAAIILVRERRRRGRDAGGGKKNVYRVDDTIQDTGYTLVRIDKAEVEIKRNNESRILALEYGDASKQRRAAAAADDQQQRKETQQQVSQNDDSPKPPPPPPPPAPGARSNNDDGQDRDQEQQDRRERIRRALEARRRLLEKRREAQKNNN